MQLKSKRGIHYRNKQVCIVKPRFEEILNSFTPVNWHSELKYKFTIIVRYTGGDLGPIRIVPRYTLIIRRAWITWIVSGEYRMI